MENNYIISEILNFIKPRNDFPKEAEIAIVKKQKEWFENALKKYINNITPENIPYIREKLKKIFFSILQNPGESIGVICGQSIGERMTQGTLNTFHSAGLDTGVITQTDSFHSIINATKKSKTDSKYLFNISLWLNNPSTSLKETKNRCIKYLNSISVEQLTINIEYKNIEIADYEKDFFQSFYNLETIKNKNFIKYTFKIWEIFFYEISRNNIISKLQDFGEIYCLPFSLLPENSNEIFLYILPNDNIFQTIKKIKNISLIGIPGITSHVFTQDLNTLEWRVDITTNNLQSIFIYGNIYNINKIMCSSIYDFFCNFGILATQKLIEHKCREIIPDVDPGHFKILAIKMTRNGYLEPLTRYTMRNNTSPLTRASFEECFETFLKAGKYQEVENYKTVSANILTGKKPKIGTYQCDILMDPKFYL